MYRFKPLPHELVHSVRTTLRFPQYGHPAHVEIASGYGPCRVCLGTFQQGLEERILFTYNPFPRDKALPQPGPIFIHREFCTPHANDSAAGLTSELPSDLRGLPLLVEGFGHGPWTVRRKSVLAGDIEGALDELFAEPGIEYAHLRNSEAGCFIAVVERVCS
jgi:hypothetical protein